MVTIKPLRLADVDNLMTWVNNPDIIKRFVTFSREKPFTREEELEYIRKSMACPKTHIYSIYDGDLYVGQVGLMSIDSCSFNARVSCLISSTEHMGKGYATKALTLLLEEAFTKLNMNKLWLQVSVPNHRATRVYRKVGFQPEAILKEEYLIDGEFVDMIRMYILKSHWEETNEKEQHVQLI
jgi:RimJ/RimL family protein N-acetyltransferase